MPSIFRESSITNVDGLSEWGTSKVENMVSMFGLARNLADIDGLESWDTSSVTDMSGMFQYVNLTDFRDLSNWDTGNVTDTSEMFYFNLGGLTDISGISGWDISNATNMSYMFAYDGGITSLTVLNDWGTSSVLEKGNMFLEIPSEITRPIWWNL